MSMKKNIIIICILTVLLTIIALPLMGQKSHAVTRSSQAYYRLYVNEQCNVVTAYKKSHGKWIPVRAMLCSTGLGGATPKGTFYTQGKWNWGTLMNDVYGQYCTHITGNVLFHSVYYLQSGNRASQVTGEYNRLGYAASHGCVRLSVMDAKWIYDNCKVGTRVTIYRSSKPGPLGKPAANRVSTYRSLYWDPTDPNPGNPYFIMKSPKIWASSKKVTTIQYGTKYNLRSRVYAKDPNTNMRISTYIKVLKVKRYSSTRKAYLSAKFSTKRLGRYKVTYRVKDPYGKSAQMTLKLKVIDNKKAPKIYGAKSHIVGYYTTNAVKGVTAKQPSGSRTAAMKVYVKRPGATIYSAFSYKSAKKYCFRKTGTYFVKYVVKNKYAPYKRTVKVIRLVSKYRAVNYAPKLYTPASRTVYVNMKNAVYRVYAKHAGKYLRTRIKVCIKRPGRANFGSAMSYKTARLYKFKMTGKYKVKYIIKNLYAPYQTVVKYKYIYSKAYPTESVKTTLTAAGYQVDTRRITNNIISGDRWSLLLNNNEHLCVRVYAYSSEAAATNSAALFSATGLQYNGKTIGIGSKPHYFKSGKLIIEYVGENATILNALNTKYGPQFAGYTSV